MNNKKYNFVYFFSEGPPHDNGQNLSENKKIVDTLIKPYFNNITHYTPRIMKDIGFGNYVKEYDESGLVWKNVYHHKIGNAAWKPKILLLELEKMNDGDILIHGDINFKQYPVYKKNGKKLISIAEDALKCCKFDFFVPRALYIKMKRTNNLDRQAKTNIIRELGENHKFTYNFPAIFGGLLLVIRKSNISMQLVKEWNDACLVDRWINTTQYGTLHENFNHSCPEQAILGVIIANWVKKKKYNIPLKYPFIGYKNRDIEKKVWFEKLKKSEWAKGIHPYKYLEYLNN